MSKARNVSLESINKGILFVPYEPLEKGSLNRDKIIVVSGKLPSKLISCDDIWSYSNEELKHVTIECDIFPMNLMQKVEYLGGIICHTGTPLSHISITAKHYNIPMIINLK